jgi:acylphosphatase
MIALRILISGRVQGVGYRDWLAHRARSLNVAGWVRNLGGDKVEAVLSGDAASVEELASMCWQGPPAANVAAIERFAADVAADSTFRRLPSA